MGKNKRASARLATKYAFREPDFQRIEVLVHVEDYASNSVASKLPGEFEDVLRNKLIFMVNPFPPNAIPSFQVTTNNRLTRARYWPQCHISRSKPYPTVMDALDPSDPMVGRLYETAYFRNGHDSSIALSLVNYYDRMGRYSEALGVLQKVVVGRNELMGKEVQTLLEELNDKSRGEANTRSPEVLENAAK